MRSVEIGKSRDRSEIPPHHLPLLIPGQVLLYDCLQLHLDLPLSRELVQNADTFEQQVDLRAHDLQLLILVHCLEVLVMAACLLQLYQLCLEQAVQLLQPFFNCPDLLLLDLLFDYSLLLLCA